MIGEIAGVLKTKLLPEFPEGDDETEFRYFFFEDRGDYHGDLHQLSAPCVNIGFAGEELAGNVSNETYMHMLITYNILVIWATEIPPGTADRLQEKEENLLKVYRAILAGGDEGSFLDLLKVGSIRRLRSTQPPDITANTENQNAVNIELTLDYFTR